MMWMHEPDAHKNETPIERLRREADDLDRSAEQMHGCSWMGDEPPWARLNRDAHDKRLLAKLLEHNFPANKDAN